MPKPIRSLMKRKPRQRVILGDCLDAKRELTPAEEKAYHALARAARRVQEAERAAEAEHQERTQGTANGTRGERDD